MDSNTMDTSVSIVLEETAMEETALPGFLLPLSSGPWAFSRWMRHACVSNMKSIKGKTGSEHVYMFGQSARWFLSEDILVQGIWSGSESVR